MNLHRFETMDPNLLLGLVNTALRNDCRDLDDLVHTHDIEREVLEQKLNDLGYIYVAEVNQFKPKQAAD